MQRALVGAVNAAGYAVDCLVCAAEAAWPRSVVNAEVERLNGEGYETGAPCDFGFVLALDPDDPDATLRAARAVGFTVEDDSQRAQGYAVVRTTLALRAFQLAWSMARLNRVAARHGGFAEMLGPSASGVALGRLRDPSPGAELRTNP